MRFFPLHGRMFTDLILEDLIQESYFNFVFEIESLIQADFELLVAEDDLEFLFLLPPLPVMGVQTGNITQFMRYMGLNLGPCAY